MLAIALLAIPSNFVPSVAISLPSTVPDTVMFPVTSRPLLISTFPYKLNWPFEAIVNLSALSVASAIIKIPFWFFMSKSSLLSVSTKLIFGRVFVISIFEVKLGEIFVPAIAALASICALTSPLLLSKVFISLAVWSAVALLSIPSNFVPSVAISLPSTVPDTDIFPVIVTPTLVVSNFWFPL